MELRGSKENRASNGAVTNWLKIENALICKWAGRDDWVLNRGCAYVNNREIHSRTASRWRSQPTDSRGLMMGR